MSIIYQALQKLERENNPQDSAKQEKFLGNKIVQVSVGILVVVVLIFIITFGRQRILEKVSSLVSLVNEKYLSDSQKPLGFQLPLPLNSSIEPAEPESYQLGGIIYDLDFPVAIINGSSFKREDLIGEYRIAEITESTVELINTKDQTKLILSIEF